MLKPFLILALLFAAPQAQARTVKMGVTPGGVGNAMMQQKKSSAAAQQARRQKAMEAAKKQKKAAAAAPKECLSTDDCPFTQECVALECRSVCYPESCPSGKRCTAFKSKPHVFQCVDCLKDAHCPDGLVCSPETFTCEKDDPCRKAVCFQDAPYCVPVAYKTLPYTCVQCTEDSHCPPVAGLSRSCVKNSCLFNVAGNIPAEKKDDGDKTEKAAALGPAEKPAGSAVVEKPAASVIVETTEDLKAGEIVYDENGTPYLVEEEEEEYEEDED